MTYVIPTAILALLALAFMLWCRGGDLMGDTFIASEAAGYEVQALRRHRKRQRARGELDLRLRDIKRACLVAIIGLVCAYLTESHAGGLMVVAHWVTSFVGWYATGYAIASCVLSFGAYRRLHHGD